MGTKDWLFSQATNEANASATLYSIIETVKANYLVPYDYLMHKMEQIMAVNTDP